MSTNASHDHESTDTEHDHVDDRTERALTECMGVLDEGGDIYTVVGENSNGEHRVDLRAGRCTCPDYEYNLPTAGGRETCKHADRVKFALGHEPVPAAFSPADVPGQLGGEHLDGEPRFLARDGGVAGATTSDTADTSAGERVRVPVAGGVLVYESRALGKELVGFENVDGWDALADALAAKGHDRGAVYHLPELDRLEGRHD